MARVQTIERPLAPREMRRERGLGLDSQVSRRFPKVIGGVCEYCGTIDPEVDAKIQYKLCSHYAGMELSCDYCGNEQNPEEVLRTTNLQIAEHPDKHGTLVMWCDRTECGKRHIERFKISK